MPVERASIELKPCGFFNFSPAMDAPRSSQNENLSRDVHGNNTSDCQSKKCCSPKAKL
jgi:hypothetical protein